MDEPLLQKTERGRQMLQSHSPALDARSRQLLVLCNGRLPTTALRALFGTSTDDLLQGLRGQGLIAPVEPEAAPAPAAPPPPDPQAEREPALDLPAARARALALLESLFGPGGGSHGEAVSRARDAQAFEQALQGVQEALSVYQGRKRAALLLRQIRDGS